jgi:hypothetical protein
LEIQENRNDAKGWGFKGFFFATGIHYHNQIFGIIRNRYPRLFENERPGKRSIQPGFAQIEIGKYIDQINYINQIICDNKVSEMKALESLSTDEYYQTISTFFRIMDERNESK